MTKLQGPALHGGLLIFFSFDDMQKVMEKLLFHF